jgi:hypothetical protein
MAIVTFNTPTDMSALSTSLSSISATSFKYEPVGSATDWLSCHGGEFDSMIGYTGHFEKTEDGVYGTIKAAYISQGQDGLPGIEVHGISYAMNDFFYTNYFWGGRHRHPGRTHPVGQRHDDRNVGRRCDAGI